MQKRLPKKSFILLMLGDPYAEKLALIYQEFQRWKELFANEFSAYLLIGRVRNIT